MAVVPVCYKMSYNKDQAHPIHRISRQIEKGLAWESIGIEGPACFSSVCSNSTGVLKKLKARTHDRSHLQFRYRTELHVSHRMSSMESCLRYNPEKASQRENPGTVRSASVSRTNEKQLKLLDSYFGRLHNEGDDEAAISENYSSSFPYNEDKHDAVPFSTTGDSIPVDEGNRKSYFKSRYRDGDIGPNNPLEAQQYDETSDLYLISILVSVNIAVVLFEQASPIRNSELEILSVPLVYGAKINDLILVGEWWRLVTPMFLHSGIFHVALGCWVLLTFGPQVCRQYGSFTFFLIYILGGISGNLSSFLHTPELTVGGTGPVFAVIGAWVIHQIQRKDVIAKDGSEDMYHKAIIATALSTILSHFYPIDDWTHFGAAFTGMAYGYLTHPTIQLDESSSKTGQEEGMTLVKRYADPCKSFIIFTLFMFVLIVVPFLIQPPLHPLESNSFE